MAADGGFTTVAASPALAGVFLAGILSAVPRADGRQPLPAARRPAVGSHRADSCPGGFGLLSALLSAHRARATGRGRVLLRDVQGVPPAGRRIDARFLPGAIPVGRRGCFRVCGRPVPRLFHGSIPVRVHAARRVPAHGFAALLPEPRSSCPHGSSELRAAHVPGASQRGPILPGSPRCPRSARSVWRQHFPGLRGIVPVCC